MPGTYGTYKEQVNKITTELSLHHGAKGRGVRHCIVRYAYLNYQGLAFESCREHTLLWIIHR